MFTLLAALTSALPFVMPDLVSVDTNALLVGGPSVAIAAGFVLDAFFGD